MGKITVNVHRSRGSYTVVLKWAMIVLGVLFLLMGIIFSRSFLLPCFFMAALYFWYDANIIRDYEYVLVDGVLTVTVIKGGSRRLTEHSIKMCDVIAFAEHDDDAVALYRKGGSEAKIRKYDYTSYDESEPYWTMIATEDGRKVKLLLDPGQEMINEVRRRMRMH